MQALTREDVPMALEADGVEFGAQELGEMSIAWVRLPAGTDLRPALAGLPGDPEAVTDCEYIDFSPTAEITAVLDHVKGQGADA